MRELTGWERFLDSLSTEGGHIVIWISLVLVGAVIIKFMNIDYGKEIMVMSMTGLGITLKAANSNMNRQYKYREDQDVSTTSTVSTEVSHKEPS